MLPLPILSYRNSSYLNQIKYKCLNSKTMLLALQLIAGAGH